MRKVVRSEECFFCLAKTEDAPLDHRLARFYIAALHLARGGDEHLCEEHALVLAEEIASHDAAEPAFRARVPRVTRLRPKTSSRLDVLVRAANELSLTRPR